MTECKESSERGVLWKGGDGEGSKNMFKKYPKMLQMWEISIHCLAIYFPFPVTHCKEKALPSGTTHKCFFKKSYSCYTALIDDIHI